MLVVVERPDGVSVCLARSVNLAVVKNSHLSNKTTVETEMCKFRYGKAENNLKDASKLHYMCFFAYVNYHNI
jgi:hypothetical protein